MIIGWCIHHVYMARLYMKIKIDGKWNFHPANTPYQEYTLKGLCECTACVPVVFS